MATPDPDLNEEQFIHRLNTILAPHAEAEYADVPEMYPTLHIVGVPRSGTTLVSQLLSSHLQVGYISNTIANFWRAPVYGIRLAQRILGSRGRPPSTYNADLGRTTGPYEPHEFSYFWRDLLAYDDHRQKPPEHDDQIDWERVRKVLVNIAQGFGGPVVFKSWLLAWHMEHVQRVLPKTCFIWIHRDLLDAAVSLLMHRKRLGSPNQWLSFKPREYEWLRHRHYCEQVAGQIYFLNKAVAEQVRRIRGHNVLEVHYTNLCANPRVFLGDVQELLERNGLCVEAVSLPPDSFEPRSSFREHDLEHQRIRDSLQHFAEGHSQPA